MEELNEMSKMELEIMEFFDNERIDYELRTNRPGLASLRNERIDDELSSNSPRLTSFRRSRTIEMGVDDLVLAMHSFSNAKVQEAVKETMEAFRGAAVKVTLRRRRANKARVANRSDQIDKRAFQEAVLANIAHYPTIAAARRDLQKKPQFQKRLDTTLERWARKVWPTKPKRGRPKNPG